MSFSIYRRVSQVTRTPGPDIEDRYQWATHQNITGKLTPKGRDFYGFYLGESYWSHAYNYLDDPSSISVYWTTAEGAT